MRFITEACGCSSEACNPPCGPSVDPRNHPKGTATGPVGRNLRDTNEPFRCHQNIESTALLQEVHEDQINGCSEEVEEWEELEFLVDSGASATVVGKEEVRAVQASEPDSSVHYRLADGSRIPNLGEKDFRAVTDEYRPLRLKAQVTEVDRPLLSVAQVVHMGGKVVFSPEASYIESTLKSGATRRDSLEFRNGLYMLKVWIPRKQDAPFQGPA